MRDSVPDNLVYGITRALFNSANRDALSASHPSAREIGSTDDPEVARQIGRTMGRELRAVHIDIDFAPVMDVDTNPENPVIAERSFGRSTALVSRMRLKSELAENAPERVTSATSADEMCLM